MTDTDEATQASDWVTVTRGEHDDVSIHARMLAILEELPAIGKTSENRQQGFMYRSHDDVLNALNPLLAKYGVFMVPRVLERTTDQRSTARGGVMYEVNLLVEYTFFGAAGDSFTASAWGEGTDSGDKSTNKAMTMAFKNVIAQAFAVSTSETVDTDSTSDPETTGRASAGRGSEPAPQRTRTAPKPRGPFDPGRDLIDGAVSGEGFLPRLGEQLQAIHPDLDWSATVGGVMYDRFGTTRVSELDDAQASEYWRRFANIAAKIISEADPNELPPATDDQIKGAIGWAYGTDGTSVELIERPPTDEELAAAEEAKQAADADTGAS